MPQSIRIDAPGHDIHSRYVAPNERSCGDATHQLCSRRDLGLHGAAREISTTNRMPDTARFGVLCELRCGLVEAPPEAIQKALAEQARREQSSNNAPPTADSTESALLAKIRELETRLDVGCPSPAPCDAFQDPIELGPGPDRKACVATQGAGGWHVAVAGHLRHDPSQGQGLGAPG